MNLKAYYNQLKAAELPEAETLLWMIYNERREDVIAETLELIAEGRLPAMEVE